MAIPVVGVIVGALKSYIVTRVMRAASEEFIHALLDEVAERFLPPLISWMRKKAKATPGEFDDALVDTTESTLKKLIGQ